MSDEFQNDFVIAVEKHLLSMKPDTKRKGCCRCLPEDNELASWYIYDFGIGPIALAIIVFAPLLVVTQAKYEASKHGIEWRHIRSDGDVCLNGGNITIHSDQDYARPSGMDEDCEWFPIDTKTGLGVDYTAVGAYISAFVLFFSAALLVFLGPIGDFGSYRKPALGLFVSIWCVAFLVPIALTSSKLYLVNGILIFVGATAWNFGNRALRNAYLPLLVRSSPLVLAKTKEINHSGALSSDAAPEAAATDDEDAIGGESRDKNDLDAKLELNKLSEQLASEYSVVTSGYFFVGQILGFVVQGLLVTLLAPKETDPSNTFGLRLCLAFAGVFGMIFCSRAIYGLGTRPGPPFHGTSCAKLTVGLRKLFVTLKLIKGEMNQMMIFLIGRTLHWTAVQSILTNATLYMEREFSLRADELVVPLVVMLLTSMVSALALGVFVKKFENSILKLTLVVCCITNLLPVYMLLGLRERWEIYVLFVLAGFLVSPFPALSRGMLAQMIPIGFSSTIMSLEGILELGTSWIGPLIIGLILDLTGSIRWGCFSMVVIMLAALPFLFRVNLNTASEERSNVESSNSEGVEAAGTDLEMFQLVPLDP